MYVAQPKKTILFTTLTNIHTNTHTLHKYILLGNLLDPYSLITLGFYSLFT